LFSQGNGSNADHKNSAASIPAPVTAAAPVVDAPVPAATPVVNTTTTEEPEFTSATETASASSAAPAATVPPVTAQIKNQRAIEALQSAWVEIKDASGKTLYTGILKSSQLLPLPDNTKVTLTTGNAGGLRLVLNGQPQAAFGQLNEVKRNIPIDVPAPVAAAPAQIPAQAPAATPAQAPSTATLPSITFER